MRWVSVRSRSPPPDTSPESTNHLAPDRALRVPLGGAPRPPARSRPRAPRARTPRRGAPARRPGRAATPAAPRRDPAPRPSRPPARPRRTTVARQPRHRPAPSLDRIAWYGIRIAAMDLSARPVVTSAEWQKAREEMLVREKEATRAQDALAAARRRMPMETLGEGLRPRRRRRARAPRRRVRGAPPAHRLQVHVDRPREPLRGVLAVRRPVRPHRPPQRPRRHARGDQLRARSPRRCPTASGWAGACRSTRRPTASSSTTSGTTARSRSTSSCATATTSTGRT